MELTHLDEYGRPKMVDVTSKELTHRVAVASGSVIMKQQTLDAILTHRVKKGDVLVVAQLAGIQAAKHTPVLVPLCHPIRITAVDVELEPDVKLPGIRIRARTEAIERTGVEMEALSAVAAAALTIYDMCKAMDRNMVLTEIRLDYKSGGKSGTFRRTNS